MFTVSDPGGGGDQMIAGLLVFLQNLTCTALRCLGELTLYIRLRVSLQGFSRLVIRIHHKSLQFLPELLVKIHKEVGAVVGGCGYKGAVGAVMGGACSRWVWLQRGGWAVMGGGLQEVGVATEPYIEYISPLPPPPPPPTPQAEHLSFPLQEERPPLPSLTTKVEAFKVQYTSS